MPEFKVGYILKRFPRASETFIAQEVLELERRAVEVEIFTLWPNDQPAPHRWIADIRAPVTVCARSTLRESWDWLYTYAQEDPAEPNAIVEVLRLAFEHASGRGSRYLAEAVAIARAAEEAGVKHLHAHFANHPTFVTLLVHLITGLPFSFTAHAKDIYANTALPDLWRRQVEAAAFVVTVSENNRLFLEQRLNHSCSAKVRRLYNGVDLESIRPVRRPTAPGTPEVLCVARLVEKKGVELLLDAIALLRKRHVNLRCTIVGDGPQAEELRRRATALRLDDTVDFLGAQTHEQVVGHLNRADLFVLPAKIAADGDRDALPTVLLEAMASGLPCLSTAVGGIPEIIAHRSTGLVVPPDNSWALAEAIAELLRNPTLCATMGRAGRRRAEKLFDRRKNVATLHRWMAEPLLEETLSGAGEN